ncbi:hypothetical protein QTO34_008234 [Cnephaeus nilssonii]|uniref:TRAPP14 C-terminal domain-containing protein n=1 Tax=Cnephaeus nilssonii TaxID=3371016 RepID=A0AA40IB72_CNENI|nr:hypothetical protein QTO34_008234 [Eptesicus nilssonii]
MQAALDSIVCHTPLNNLGFSWKGSALTFSVAFQVGSVMEGRAITSPVASTVGRPLYLRPEKAVLSLDEIAKCKVLVVEAIK